MFRELAIAAFLEAMFRRELSSMRGYARRSINRGKFLDEKRFVVRILRSQDYLALEKYSLV